MVDVQYDYHLIQINQKMNSATLSFTLKNRFYDWKINLLKAIIEELLKAIPVTTHSYALDIELFEDAELKVLGLR